LFLSLLGLPFCAFPSILGIFVGFAALKEIGQSGERGRDLARASIAIGAVVVGVWIIVALTSR
jgi:hypothetical protein